MKFWGKNWRGQFNDAHDYYRFDPKEDLTAFELAKGRHYIGEIVVDANHAFDALGDAQRHWVKVTAAEAEAQFEANMLRVR